MRSNRSLLAAPLYTVDTSQSIKWWRQTGSEKTATTVTACREVVVMAVGAVEFFVLGRERMIHQ